MVTSSKQTGQAENNNNNKTKKTENIRDVAASLFLRKQENQQSNKQTCIRLFVLVTVALTVIYFTSPFVVVVPYCQLSWCLCGNLCKSRVQLWHLKSANAHGACSCHKLLVRTHTHSRQAYVVQDFCSHTTAVSQIELNGAKLFN